MAVGLAALVAVGLVVGASSVRWSMVQAADRDGFNRDVEQAAETVRQRLGLLDTHLHAGRAFLASSIRVEPSEWRRFVAALRKSGPRCPGTGLAWVESVRPPAGGADPSPDRFSAIVRLSALPSNHAVPRGLDLAADSGPRSVLLAAAREDRSVTGTIVAPPPELAAWTAMSCLPVYRDGIAPADPEDRAAATTGWIVAPISLPRFARVVATELPAVDVDALELHPEPRGGVTDPPPTDQRAAAFDPGTRHWRSETIIDRGDARWIMAISRPARPRGDTLARVLPTTLGTSLIGGLLLALTVSRTGTRARARRLAADMTTAVARQSALLDATGRLARLGTWEFVEDDATVHWSRTLCDLHGVAAPFSPELPQALSFLDDDSRARAESVLAAARERGKPWDEELVLHRADDGRRVVVRSLGSVEELPDGRRRFWGAMQDVTEQVAAREEIQAAWRHAQTANRAKSTFLANMSHEIRTPMTAILGFVEMMQEMGDIDDAGMREEALATIHRNGQHLLELLNDILDLSKIEAGRMTVERLHVAIPELLSEVTSLMRVRAAARGLYLRTGYDTPIPETVLTDPVRVRQIVANLVGNAIKFTETGGVTLSVSFTPHGERSGTLRLAVEDTGIGMDAAQRKRIFDAFSQGDDSMTRRFGGTGLGLRISATLAEMLDGGIDVESEPGAGSTFTVHLDTGDVSGCRLIHPDTGGPDGCEGEGEAGTLRLPERDAQPGFETATVPASTDGAAAGPPLEGARILVAEDGLDNQRLLRHLLQRAGADVQVVTNGREAVDAIDAAATAGEDAPASDGPSPFDLLLLDMQMPVMNGYQAARELRRRHHDLPIIAVTAHAMSDDRWKCIDAGCDDYASKPIDRQRLIETCRVAIERMGGGFDGQREAA